MMITKRNFFETVAEMNDEILSTYFDEAAETVRDFCAKQIVQLEKRASVPTAKQKENDTIKADVIEILSDAGEPMEVEGIRSALNAIHSELSAPLTSQRVSALLSQLVKAEQIVRIAPKGKAKVTFTMPKGE